jgi:hypothetical protein
MSFSITQLIEKNKINSENLRRIYNELHKLISHNEKISNVENDIKILIESIIEFLLHGDKNDSSIFYVFCELNFMNEFIFLSNQKSKVINLQIIKSFALLITNLTNKQSLYFLFSNNFINQIISGDYEIIDSDFLSYYVNFIKSLSLKLDETTIQFFYHKQMNTFPLLTNTLKLYNHSDPMVSNVVRNIFLTISKIKYEPVTQYICGLPTLSYFCFITCRTRDLIKSLNIKVIQQEQETVNALNEEIVNDILFFQDIYSLNIIKFNFILTNCIFHYIIIPVLCASISMKPITHLQNGNINSNIVSVEVAMYLLYLFLKYIKNENFINSMVSILFMERIHCKILNQLNSPPLDLYNYNSDWDNTVKASSKKMKFREYIMTNFDEKFIRSLIYHLNSPYSDINTLIQKLEAKGINSDMQINSSELYKNILEELNRFFSDREMNNMQIYHSAISQATGIQCGLTYKADRNCFLHLFNKTLLFCKQNYLGQINKDKYVINIIRNNFIELLKSKSKSLIQIAMIFIYSLFNNDYISKELLAFIKFLTPDEIKINLNKGKSPNINIPFIENKNSLQNFLKISKEEENKITFATLFPFTTKDKFKFKTLFIANNQIISTYLQNNQMNYNNDFIELFINIILTEPLKYNILIYLLSLANIRHLTLFKNENKFITLNNKLRNSIKHFHIFNLTQLIHLLDKSKIIQVQCLLLYESEQQQISKGKEHFIKETLSDPYKLLHQENELNNNIKDNQTETAKSISHTEADIELYKLRLLNLFCLYDLFCNTFNLTKINFNETKEKLMQSLKDEEKKLNKGNSDFSDLIDRVLKCKICTEIGQVFKEGTLCLNKDNILEIKIDELSFELKLTMSNVEIQIDRSEPRIIQIVYIDNKGEFQIMFLSFDDNAVQTSVQINRLLEIKSYYARYRDFRIMMNYFERLSEQYKNTT